jgi:DNA-binding GntR family transcriptional regulator
MQVNRQTLAQQAYLEIRRLIVTGVLAPSSKVKVLPLAEGLNLSATPVKAALAALERDSFLTAVPHRGYFVPDVGLKDMREIYELREVLDGIAARTAARMEDPAAFVETVLMPLYERQKDCIERQDGLGYSDADLEFHEAIGHISHNSRLRRVTENLSGQFRFGSGSSSTLPGRVPEALREHEAIMKAIAAADSRRAEEISRTHVRLAAEAFEAAWTHAHSD